MSPDAYDGGNIATRAILSTSIVTARVTCGVSRVMTNKIFHCLITILGCTGISRRYFANNVIGIEKRKIHQTNVCFSLECIAEAI